MKEIVFYTEELKNAPKKGTALASGYDVRATKILKVFKGSVETTGEKLEKIQKSFLERGKLKLRPHERVLFGTGVFAELPEDVEIQVRNRSGLSLKQGLLVPPGTVDPDYKGEIGVTLINTTPYLNEVGLGERIAQIVPNKLLTEIDTYILPKQGVELSDSERGDNGFGSTGKQ